MALPLHFQRHEFGPFSKEVIFGRAWGRQCASDQASVTEAESAWAHAPGTYRQLTPQPHPNPSCSSRRSKFNRSGLLLLALVSQHGGQTGLPSKNESNSSRSSGASKKSPPPPPPPPVSPPSDPSAPSTTADSVDGSLLTLGMFSLIEPRSSGVVSGR
jgi:hypothetical protein